MPVSSNKSRSFVKNEFIRKSEKEASKSKDLAGMKTMLNID